MKKALLFYGFLPPNVNKYNAKYDVYLSYVYWKKHVLDCNTDLDIFIHTWDASQAQIDEVIDVFHPKSICNDKLVHADAPASSCLSMKRVNELAKGEYDMLMICRMDVIWSAPLFLEKTFDPSKIINFIIKK